MKEITLDRLLRAGVAGAIPPLWAEIAVLHYRGSYQSPYMWIPVTTLPMVLVGGLVSVLTRDAEESRATFRPLAWLMAAIGVIGTLFHLRGVSRQMGGFYNWKYNIPTGPPFPAPPQVAILGLLGVAASAPRQPDTPATLVRAIRAVNVGSYTLLAIEAGYDHWMGGLYNKVMFTPLTLGPLMALLHAATLVRSRTARALEGPMSVVAAIAGLVGFIFHLRNVRHRPGYFWQRLFYGAPVAAPLMMFGTGVLGLLAALFGKRR